MSNLTLLTMSNEKMRKMCTLANYEKTSSNYWKRPNPNFLLKLQLRQIRCLTLQKLLSCLYKPFTESIF